MSDGMAERKMGAALAKSLPTATAPKNSLPVRTSEISRLQRTIGELGNALKTGAITVPAHAINLRVALEGATRVRGSLDERDRNLLAELEPRARRLLAQADAAKAVSTAKVADTGADDLQLDWDAVTDVFDQMTPGMGPAIKLAPQSHRDAIEAMTRSPLFALQVFEESWDDIKDHWFELLQFTATMIAAEVAVGILVAVPEPSLGTKIAAFVLQALILAFAIHAAYTAGAAAIAFATDFWSKVTAANGDLKKIDEAALAFVRLVFALFQTLAAAAGIGKAAKFRTPADVPPTPRPGSRNHDSNNGSKSTERTKTDSGEPKAHDNGPKTQKDPSLSAKVVVEYRVERHQIRVETRRTKGGWSLEVKAPLPDGRRTHTVGDVYVAIDEHGAPVGGPAFTIDKEAFVDGVSGKVQIYEGSTRISATDLVLDETIAAFRKEFGHAPDRLPGSLAWENKLNFQRAYATAAQSGVTHDAASQIAIREISFGRSRAARGYDTFLVEATNFAEIDLGGSLGVRRVPTTIKADARRSK
jgi:hypothetical protein